MIYLYSSIKLRISVKPQLISRRLLVFKKYQTMKAQFIKFLSYLHFHISQYQSKYPEFYFNYLNINSLHYLYKSPIFKFYVISYPSIINICFFYRILQEMFLTLILIGMNITGLFL